MADTLQFRPDFSGNFYLANGSVQHVPAGGVLADLLTGKPFALGDGEEDRLRALGAFDVEDTAPHLLVPPGLAPPVIPKDPEAKAAEKAAAGAAKKAADDGQQVGAQKAAPKTAPPK